MFVLVGYWPLGTIGPSGFFTTPDELYLREWLLRAAYTHSLAEPTFPYGSLFHVWIAGWMWAVVKLHPTALGLESFTSWVRACNGVLWLLFGVYLTVWIRPVPRRVWIALALLNPVVLFAAFGYAKPDFLMFALGTVAALHWSRALAGGEARDLYIAAAVLGAATATKLSVLILTGPWYVGMAIWSNVWRTFGVRRLALAVVTSVAICLALCPEYIRITATIASMASESQLVRHGFPGTHVYSPWMWATVLALSFPLEMTWLAADARRHVFVRRSAVLWCVLLLVFIVSVRRFMPVYLLPLMAVAVGVGLSTSQEDKKAAVLGTLGLATVFTLLCLSPKVALTRGFLTATAYGRAAEELRAQHAHAVPLSEVSLDPAGAERVAHFWTPKTMAELRAALDHPRGWYVLADDSIIKATVTPFGLDLSSDEYLAGEYTRFISQFRSKFANQIVFAQTYSFETEQLFYEIHAGGYWPWRYLLARLRHEAIAPSTGVTLYRFPST
jgi:hypothetical protein